MKILRKLRIASRIAREKGLAGIQDKLNDLRRRAREQKAYQRWIKAHELTGEKRAVLRAEMARFESRPLISVVLPVYNVEEKWLRKCVESVFRQLYENWELCVADDKSPSPHVRRILEEYAAGNERVKVVFRPENGHISAASNSALALATGEFCVLLDHDDELTEDALFYVAKELNEFPETAFIYSDEDMIGTDGERHHPKFKPDFSRDLLYSLNLITHLSAYRTEILRKIGGFRMGTEGSQDYDLALRFFEQIDEKQIRHIPRILYHWRAIAGSVALSADEKPYAHERARQALRDHFERTGKTAAVERGAYQFHRVRYALPEILPRVSLILFSPGDFETAVKRAESIASVTDYENLEIVLIYRNGAPSQPARENIKVLSGADCSKAESLNRAARQSDGEILCFADAVLEPVEENWLKELTSFARQRQIGAVGGKITDQDERVVHGGLILGFGGLIGAAHQKFPADADGYFSRLKVINNYSAVSVSCLATRRGLFDEIGGFDAGSLPDGLFDADFCLKLGERNLRVVFTPYAQLTETENNAPPTLNDREREFFRRRWQSVIGRDPFYNPNLSLTGETFTIKI